MKILSVGAKFFSAYRRTDGQTDRRADMAKLIVAFRNFAIAAVIIQNIFFKIIHAIALI